MCDEELKHRKNLRHRKAVVSEQITLSDVCRMMAHQLDVHGNPVWVSKATGLPTKVQLQKMRRRFRRAEQELGEKLLFGGGKWRRGRGKKKTGGGELWTTMQKLREAGFIDDLQVIGAMVSKQVRELQDEVRELGARQRALAQAYAEKTKRLEARIKRLENAWGWN